jgi:outer membrane protein insertion porin family
VSDWRFSPVWVAFLAASAAIALPQTAKAEGSVTNGVQVRDAMMVASATVPDRPSDQLQPPIESKVELKVESKAETRIESKTEAVEESVAKSVNVPEVAATEAAVAPAVVAQADQDTPNTLKISPGGPNKPVNSTIDAPVRAAPQLAPTPSQAPELPPSRTLAPPLGTPPTRTPPVTPPVGEAAAEARVLVSEVVVAGAGKRELEDEVYRVIKTRPGQTTTRSQLQEDINAIFATGYFATVQAEPKDTNLGVQVTFQVGPNPVLKTVRVEGSEIVKQPDVDGIFQTQYGNTLNYRELQRGVQDLTKRYQDQGYVLAQVAELPKVGEDGVVILQVSEGSIESMRIRYFDKEGKELLNKEGKPSGRTREFIVLREMETKPGGIFNRKTAERDLGRLAGIGLFEDVKLSLDPGQDPRKAIVNVNVVEKKGGSIAAGAGVSSASGLFGTISYQQQNLGGNNQKLGAEFQLGQRELLFDANFSDPWIAGDQFRTGYTINGFRRRSVSLIYDGGNDVRILNTGRSDADRVRIVRTGGGISFSRPLSKNVFARSPWSASLGLQYQRVTIQDGDGKIVDPNAPQVLRNATTGLLTPVAASGRDLSASGTSRDDLLTLQLGFVNDRRNDALRPTSGSLLRFGTEQSIPVGNGNIFFNRLRGSYSQYIPTRLLKLSPGCRAKAKVPDCPQAFAFNLQAGTTLGKLPPYEAFSLGGSNSIRGYEEGDVGSGSSFLQATLEYRFPIFSVISGALFADAGTDLGTGKDLKGNPAGLRGKPGNGFGYGLGLRIQSPLGPIRIDYGFGDRGQGRFHFGIGERF